MSNLIARSFDIVRGVSEVFVAVVDGRCEEREGAALAVAAAPGRITLPLAAEVPVRAEALHTGGCGWRGHGWLC